MDHVLEMAGIEKTFGPVKALAGVDFNLVRGEVHALVGVNGAGKSTLVKILSGIYTADRGTISIDGSTRSIRNPSDAIACGVASVQQHPELVDDFTGYENIFLGQEVGGRGLLARVDRRSMKNRAAELLQRLPVEIDLTVPVNRLSGVEREIVAILHSLRQDNVKVLILDEPTSTLTQVEKEQLFKMMRALAGAGVSIIYITHRLEEVFEIADRFTVFRGGQTIASMACEDARKGDISIPSLMLQEKVDALFPPKAPAELTDAPVMEVRGLSARSFDTVSFAAKKGEIIGFFGLVGSGIDELAKTLFGVMRPEAGEISLNGYPVTLSGPNDALKKGIFLLPGDRRTEGLVMTDNVVFNAILANLGRASWPGGLLHFGGNRRAVAALADKVDLTPPTLGRPLSAFSGGNQQKVVIAKGLYCRSAVYIFVEPTVGVDVGARSKIYTLMRELSRDAAVIVMSSDCDEVHGVADRVGALYRGRMVLEPRRTVSRDRVLAGGIMGTVH